MQKAENRKGGLAACGGFTLIEVIAVLLLLGILSAVVFYVGGWNTEADLAAATDSLRSHLRYAQTQAMNRNNIAAATPWGISSNGNRHWLFEGNVGQERVLPDVGDVRQAGLPAQPRANAFTVFFDDRGIPHSAVNVPWTDANNPIVVTDPNTGATRNITITPLTGFIQ